MTIKLKTDGRRDWRTPRWLIERLNEEFDFTLDASASTYDHIAPNWLDEDLDGLSVVWFCRVFVNMAMTENPRSTRTSVELAARSRSG